MEVDVPNACITSDIESNAGCEGVELIVSVALPLTPFVPLAGSPFSSSVVILPSVTFFSSSPPSLFLPFFLLFTLSDVYNMYPNSSCAKYILRRDEITAAIARPV